jgi:hypothetical protein
MIADYRLSCIGTIVACEVYPELIEGSLTCTFCNSIRIAAVPPKQSAYIPCQCRIDSCKI